MKKRILILFCCTFLTACAEIPIEDELIERVEDIRIEESDIEQNNVEQNDAEQKKIETAEVADIVDGDTIKVYLDGERYTIRMIGIDTPESVHPDPQKNTIYGQKASEYAKQVFTKGQTVYLSQDVSDKDKYDRLLRYVWLEKPTDTADEIEIRQKMYNAKVVLDGYANVHEYAPNNTLYPLFLTFEAEAEKENRGLWAENGLSRENIEDDILIGNKNSKKLHSVDCADLPQEKNRVYFDSKAEALEQGYEMDKCMK